VSSTVEQSPLVHFVIGFRFSHPQLGIPGAMERKTREVASMNDTKSEARELLKAISLEIAAELRTLSKGKHWHKLSQPERRMYVRSTFAAIEAWIYVMKQMALGWHPDPNCLTISEAERLFAQEHEYRLTDSGEVETRRTKISLEANLRFGFKLLAKAGSVPSVLDVSGSEWQSLKRAIKIRDRITHPKSISDFNISDEDYNDVSVGFGWVLSSYGKLVAEIVLKAKSEAE
jgi:hypothetical protein